MLGTTVGVWLFCAQKWQWVTISLVFWAIYGAMTWLLYLNREPLIKWDSGYAKLLGP